MNDAETVELLQWALPRIGLRWEGFRNVRRQVVKRIAARIRELGLPDVAAYRQRLEEDPAELRALDALSFVTISRFYRDRGVFDALRRSLLPDLAELARGRGDRALRVWSAGCASGEEPYTVAILWHLELAARFPELALDVIATDYDAAVLERTARACYEPSSLREMPDEWRDRALVAEGGLLCVREPLRRGVTFARHDVRSWSPEPPIHLVLCRNTAFTYFAEAEQRAFLERVRRIVVPGSLLAIGGHEHLPADAPGIDALPEQRSVFRISPPA